MADNGDAKAPEEEVPKAVPAEAVAEEPAAPEAEKVSDEKVLERLREILKGVDLNVTTGRHCPGVVMGYFNALGRPRGCMCPSWPDHTVVRARRAEKMLRKQLEDEFKQDMAALKKQIRGEVRGVPTDRFSPTTGAHFPSTPPPRLNAD